MSELKHLAIIPDGNRRWAKQHGLTSAQGHRQGFEQVKTIGLAALELGIEHFTLWGFSTENWKRSQEEVGFLMNLLMQALTTELDFYLTHSIRLRIIGDRTGFSVPLQHAMTTAEEKTQLGTKGQFNVCVNYGGRAEIVAGVKKMIEAGVSADQIDEQSVSSYLWTHDLPEPDCIIRTSGEQRLSGFLSWLGSYSELMFVDVFWPEFSENDLKKCVEAFYARDRRFGS